MSNSLRAVVFTPVLVAAAAVLSGCTAGEIVAADGSALTGYAGPSTVTFRSATTGQQYTVSASQSSTLLSPAESSVLLSGAQAALPRSAYDSVTTDGCAPSLCITYNDVP